MNCQPTDAPYRTILADPPWALGQFSPRGAHRHYPVMSVEEICALPVAQLVAEDAHLWLWVTNGTLFSAQSVMEAWGFSYRSTLTWIKPRYGLGEYLRNQTEHLMLGVRGRPPVLFRGQGTWLFAPLQDHSHKPEEQYAVIERVLSRALFGTLWAPSPVRPACVGE
jgi:N6-adenosine-specific RNA methylase IME4